MKKQYTHIYLENIRKTKVKVPLVFIHGYHPPRSIYIPCFCSFIRTCCLFCSPSPHRASVRIRTKLYTQLINTHNLYMGEHLRLLSFYVALLFVDYEVLKHSWNWIVSQNNMSIVFSFYVLQMCLLLLEPCIKFSIYLYERFTGYEINELDAKLNIIGFAINLPRLVILNFLGFWVMIRFRFSFFFIFVIIELVVEFLQLIKNFTKIRGLSKIMDTLPKISREEIELKRLDDTCMVCFR